MTFAWVAADADVDSHGREDCHQAGVGGDCDFAWVVDIAVVPAEEDVTCIGCGIDEYAVAVSVDAGAVDRAHAAIVTGEEHSVVQRLEEGHVGEVACDDNGTQCVGAAIVPVHQLVAWGWGGLDLDSVAVVVGAAAADGAEVGIVGDNVDEEPVGLEGGCEGGVAVDGEYAWVVGVAVVPFDEVVEGSWLRYEDSDVAVVVLAGAVDEAHGAVVGVGSDGEGRDGEVGRVGGVAAYQDAARVGCGAVVPAEE